MFAHPVNRSFSICRIADHALGHLPGCELELRLDHRHEVGRRLGGGGHAAQEPRQGDERDVGHHQRNRLGQVDRVIRLRVQACRVRPLHGDDAGVRPQQVRQLTTSHIQSIDAASAPFQEAVCEATGRGANVQADATGDVDPERVQRAGQFLPSPRDERCGPEATAAYEAYWTSGPQGLCSWATVAAELHRRGYDGTVCLTAEYSDTGAVDRLIAEDIAYARSLLARPA